MAIDPTAIGATTEPMLFEWNERDTMLYALGVGAGTDDLSFTTENSHDLAQQVLPTYAVICCPAFAAGALIGKFNWALLLHGSQSIRLHAPLPASGKLSVVTEVADIQDKGEGKNAIVMLRGRGTDPESGELVAETLSTAVIRQAGGFGGVPGQRPVAPEFPDRAPDARIERLIDWIERVGVDDLEVVEADRLFFCNLFATRGRQLCRITLTGFPGFLHAQQRAMEYQRLLPLRRIEIGVA